MAGLFTSQRASAAQESMLVKGGSAEAAIVVGRDAGDFHRWVAGELQRYIKQLSGAELAIVASDKLPAAKPLIVVGTRKPIPWPPQQKRNDW